MGMRITVEQVQKALAGGLTVQDYWRITPSLKKMT
jgi:hypothetical protein